MNSIDLPDLPDFVWDLSIWKIIFKLILLFKSFINKEKSEIKFLDSGFLVTMTSRTNSKLRILLEKKYNFKRAKIVVYYSYEKNNRIAISFPIKLHTKGKKRVMWEIPIKPCHRNLDISTRYRKETYKSIDEKMICEMVRLYINGKLKNTIKNNINPN